MEMDGAIDIVLLDVTVGVTKRDDVTDNDGVIDLDTLDVPKRDDVTDNDGVIDLDPLDVPDDVPE